MLPDTHAANALVAALPPLDLEAIRQVAAVAVARGHGVFLVGGLPRDVVLGVPPGPDIDLVIEGDAVGVAQAVAERHGGQATAFARFGTAKWTRRDGTSIDLVSTRAESYPHPAALPTVERGTLADDLGRRDFTVNALAIDVSAARFGEVVDPCGGMADLSAGVVRVMHAQSFVDDPTRILRAVRLEDRLGFRMDAQTAALVPQAVSLLARVSGARIRNELRQVFVEPDPALTLRRLEATGALTAIVAGLGPGKHIDRLLDAVPAAWAAWRRDDRASIARPSRDALLALWLAEQGAVAPAAIRRLDLDAGARRLVGAIQSIHAAPAWLDDAEAPASAIFHYFEPMPRAALALAWLSSERPVLRRHLWRFDHELAHVAPPLGGTDLIGLGAVVGPSFGPALRALFDARLDGRIVTRADAIAMARQLLALPQEAQS